MLRLADAAQAAGVTPARLQCYLMVGVVSPTQMSAGHQRLFDSHAVQRIAVIKLLNDSGYSLRDIREIFLDKAVFGKIDPDTHLNYRLKCILNEGDPAMPTVIQKEEAHKLVERLPNNATWDDLMHQIYVRQAIDQGLADSQAGRTNNVQEVRTKYGLPE